MLLVVPISQSDKHLIPNTERAFELFPPGNKHELLVVGTPNVKPDVESLVGFLAKYFDLSAAHNFDQDNYLGWPSAPNYYFQQVCFHVAPLDTPWFWFELDCTPLRAGWLSAIESEYNDGLRTFMGVVERTYRGFDGKLLDEADGGNHMAACGVYPGDITGSVVPLRGVSSTDIPWWSFLQWYIAPYARHTNLIQNNYKTKNYHKEDGKIVCDSCNNTAWGNHYNNPISDKAALVHGCKDGSLLKLLIGDFISLEVHTVGSEVPASYRRGRKPKGMRELATV